MTRLRLALALCLLGWTASAEAAITFVAATAAGTANGDSVTTSAINCTGASLLVVILSETTNATPNTPTDSSSNTWTALTLFQTVGSTLVRGFYVANPTVSASQTVSYTHASNFPALAFACYAGVTTTTPLDVQTGGVNASATSFSPGSLTPAVANELFVTGISFGSSETMSLGSGWTVRAQRNYLQDSSNFGVAIGDKIATDSLAENPTWSWATSTEIGSDHAAFKPSGGSPPPTCQGTLSTLGVSRCGEAAGTK